MTSRIIEKDMYESLAYTVQFLTTEELTTVKSQLNDKLIELEALHDAATTPMYSNHKQQYVTHELLRIIRVELSHRSAYEFDGDGTYDEYLNFIAELSVYVDELTPHTFLSTISTPTEEVK